MVKSAKFLSFSVQLTKEETDNESLHKIAYTCAFVCICVVCVYVYMATIYRHEYLNKYSRTFSALHIYRYIRCMCSYIILYDYQFMYVCIDACIFALI